MLVDTCVWLDLAQEQKHTLLLLVIESMVKADLLSLIVPCVVLEEFHKNRTRVAEASARSLTAHFLQVKDAVERAGGDERGNKTLLAQFDDVNHRISIIGGSAEGVLNRIDELLETATVIEALDDVLLRAANRALHPKAPCHHENKNSMADAVVIETYFEVIKNLRTAGQRFAFVTHNKCDFSLMSGNQKLPHEDFATLFTKIKSMYFIDLTDCLRRIQPSMVTELMWEQSWIHEPRSLSELLKAEDLLFHQA